MRILITGAAGFIGSHLTRHLVAKGHSVGALVRHSATCSEASQQREATLAKLARKNGNDLTIVQCENPDSVASAVARFRPEICVHLAGRSWVRESIAWPQLYAEANYRFTVGLAKALSACDCRRIVFASSVMVYGLDAPLPYGEDAIGSVPASPYGSSKLAGEVLLNTYRALGLLEVINLRIFSVYGPGLREDLVPFLIARAILKGKPFTVLGDGSAVRDYIEIRDLVDAIEAACVTPHTHETLNIGSGFGTSLMDLIRTIEKALNKQADLIYKPAVHGELAVAVPDITRAIEKLKWEPKVNLEQGMTRLAEWFTSADGPR